MLPLLGLPGCARCRPRCRTAASSCRARTSQHRRADDQHGVPGRRHPLPRAVAVAHRLPQLRCQHVRVAGRPGRAGRGRRRPRCSSRSARTGDLVELGLVRRAGRRDREQGLQVGSVIAAPRCPGPAAGWRCGPGRSSPPATRRRGDHARAARRRPAAGHAAPGSAQEPACCGSQRPEPVTEPRTVCMYTGAAGVVLDLRAQPLHARVHEPRVAEVAVLPHRLQQLLAAEHPARRAGQLEQQAQLGRGEPDRLAVLG